MNDETGTFFGSLNKLLLAIQVLHTHIKQHVLQTIHQDYVTTNPVTIMTSSLLQLLNELVYNLWLTCQCSQCMRDDLAACCVAL